MSERTALAAVTAPIRRTSSTTLGELTRRRLVLLVLAALTTASLFHAYRGVHADAVPLKSRSAPGVLAVDTAEDALWQAQKGVAKNITSDFHTRVSVAYQSLARAAGADVTGLTGRETIATVTGQIATYSGWVEEAEAQTPDGPPTGADYPGKSLREAYLSYADGVLGVDPKAPGADSKVMGRLKALQSAQQEVVRAQTDFGLLLWLEWSVAIALALALLVLLAEAHRFSGARFRRRWNPALLGAGVLLAAGIAVLVVFTVLTHAGMADARTALTHAGMADARTALTQAGTADTSTALAASHAGDAIPKAGAEVSRRLAGSGFRAAAAFWILGVGALLGGLVGVGLQPRINEYRVKAVVLRWPRPRSLGVVGVCLALLAGVGVIAVQATGWNGSVTLLASWTGDEQQVFQDKVIDEFEDKYRIHVVYQGSSAESQVLAADVAGTPPDIAVLPGPGELADYAGKGLLTPLDDLVREADFAPTWVTPVKGTDGKPHTYWLPIKTDLKSMVWHAPGTDVAKAAKDPASWCLGMGSDATSGWPGTDWIEDIVLQQNEPAVYSQWATGQLSWQDPTVRRAWTTWGDMVGAGSPNAADALRRPFGDAAEGAAAEPPTCSLEHQSSIARVSDGWTKAGGVYSDSAGVIPGSKAAGGKRWEVSGDLAAVLHSTPQSRKLISYLASDEAQSAWSARSGFSVQHDVLTGYPETGPTGAMVKTLRNSKATLCYDASDAMPARVRDAFAVAVLRYLADPSTLGDQLAALDNVGPAPATGPAPLTSVCSYGLSP